MTRTHWLVVLTAIIVLDDSCAIRAQEKEPAKQFTNGLGMKFVWIPPGTFMMGSPKEEEGRKLDEIQHKVTLIKGYYLGVYTVTQEQWQAVMGNNPSNHKGEKNLPVDSVAWDDCQVFLEKLRNKDGHVYRLPTEAEWEFACRAGSTVAYCCGDDRDLLNEYAWHGWNSGNKTNPVGQKRPNAWGLFDVHGNLWQWCADSYGDYPQSDVTDQPSPYLGLSHVSALIKKLGSPAFAERQAATKALKEIGPRALFPLRLAAHGGLDLETQRRVELLLAAIPAQEKHFVLRGGSYSVLPWTVRCACRNYNEPCMRNCNYGVRVALTLSAK